MKIPVIFGTRPEAIKMAPVIIALGEYRALSCHVCVTAQHRGMPDQVLQVFQIQPDADLGLMLPDQSVGSLTARGGGEAIDNYPAKERPNLILIQGDTTGVLCAAD
jgi:UDP-N-acetylglucosamine 2-epimerase (non-hydrolysing)